MVDERGLDLDRRDPVAGHIHDIVDATEEPEVAVLVDSRAVTCEVHPGEALPVRRAEATVVAEDAARHRGPRTLEHQVAPTSRSDVVSEVVDDAGVDSGERPRG